MLDNLTKNLIFLIHMKWVQFYQVKLTKTSTTSKANIDPTTAGITVLMSRISQLGKYSIYSTFTLGADNWVGIGVLGDFEGLNLNATQS